MSLRLLQKQVETLHKAALASFNDEATLRLWVQFKMGVNLNVIKKDPGLPAIVLELFYYVEGGNTWISFLQAGAESMDRPLFRDACKSSLELLQQAQPATLVGLVNQKPLIWDMTPFVDRQSFWIDVDELRTSSRKRVLMLSGPRKSGKSYCGELIDHLRRDHWRTADFALIDLKNEQSPDIKPEELCRRILLKLRILDVEEIPPPLPGQKPDRWARDLAVWLGKRIGQIGTEVWVVLDGFSDQSVVEETHVLIAGLAEEAGDQENFRLVLLDYERAFGERTERATRRTQIEYLTASDIGLFLDLLDREYNISTKPEWQAAQLFIELYNQHTPGSATQIDALAELLPPIVRSLMSHHT